MDGLKLTTSEIKNYLHLTNNLFVTWTNLKNYSRPDFSTSVET